MKVLLLTPSLAKPGGIQRYSSTLGRALQDLLGEPSVKCVAVGEDVAGQGGKRLSSSSKWRFGGEALRAAVRWHPDLILCSHLALGPVGRLLAGLRRRPYWVVVHGIEAWGRLPYWKHAALMNAHRVIVTSNFSQNQVVKRHRIDLRRVATLPCVLDERLLGATPVESGACARIPPGNLLVLTVARMAASERYKGHDEVLRSLPSVLKQVPNLTYALVGDGDDRPRLEGVARMLGIADHTLFTGEVTDSELAALYRRSEVFALPARTVIDDHDPKGEGFGIVFLEAMAFGKPVIGPQQGAPAEFIRNDESGLLVEPDDVAGIAEALIDLLTHPDKARNMGRAGGEQVQTLYSYRAFRETLRRLLNRSDTVLLGEVEQPTLSRRRAD